MERAPLTFNEILHQSLLDQYQSIPSTNNDRDFYAKQAVKNSVRLHIQRQLIDLYPNIQANDTAAVKIKTMSDNLANYSVENNRFLTTDYLRRYIDSQLKLEIDEHFDKLFGGISRAVNTTYKTKVINELKDSRIHRDQAERLINSFTDIEKRDIIKSTVRKLPYYETIFAGEDFTKSRGVVDIDFDLQVYCVKHGLGVTADVYLKFFKSIIDDFIKTVGTFDIPHPVALYLISETKCNKVTDEEKVKYYGFLDSGTHEKIKELMDVLRTTKDFSDLPENYDDIGDYIKYNPEKFGMFMSILKKAILAGRGFTPKIEEQHGTQYVF